MRKLTFCICENKGADQLRGNLEADQCLCFRYIVQSLNFLNPKFQASSHSLNSLVCVGPGRKPECWFSHDEAHETLSDKPNEDPDQPRHPSSLSSLCCPHEEGKGPYLVLEHTV